MLNNLTNGLQRIVINIGEHRIRAREVRGTHLCKLLKFDSSRTLVELDICRCLIRALFLGFFLTNVALKSNSSRTRVHAGKTCRGPPYRGPTAFARPDSGRFIKSESKLVGQESKFTSTIHLRLTCLPGIKVRITLSRSGTRQANCPSFPTDAFPKNKTL